MNEDDAFDLLCYVLYDCGLREQYKPDMEALQVCDIFYYRWRNHHCF